MDLRKQVKQALRHCGHALVGTIHDRLNGIEGMLHQILEQNTHIASTQTALLQSEIHLVENMGRIHAELMEAEDRASSKPELQALTAAVTELRESSAGGEDFQELGDRIAMLQNILAQNPEIASPRTALLQSSELAEKTGAGAVQAGVDKMLELSDEMRRAIAASLAVLEPAAHQMREFLANQSVRQICVETSDYFFTNPELGLITFLYSYLPTRTVVDVGAHIGDVSEHLLNTGYEVYAFEPYPESYQRLTERLGGHAGFHGFNLALGSVTGELPLYTVRDSSPDNRYEDPTVFHSLAPHGMPDDLSFENAVPVPIRKLSELHREGLVPRAASLVKIDTEGYDFEVILGMEEYRYPVVMIEFWDAAIPFATQGLRYTVRSMVREMRQRGYLWSIVIYRVWGQNETAFFCNRDQSVSGSWGNVLFFQDREIFAEAQKWCSAVLPRTYFKHKPASRESLSKEVVGSIREQRSIASAPGRHH